MARMKFLCDADRCIECNACVTACKNENEILLGHKSPARRDDQRRQTRRALGFHGLHALHRCALCRCLPGELLFYDR